MADINLNDLLEKRQADSQKACQPSMKSTKQLISMPKSKA